MPGILEALTSCGFTCYEPSNASSGTEFEDDTNNRPVYREFETPPTKREQLPVQDIPSEAPSIFRYFVDGSMRTTNAGYIVDAKRQFWPIFIAQIGVAATTLNDRRMGLETHSDKTILFLPGTTAKADEREARKRVQDAAATSRMPLELRLDLYSASEGEKPIEAARKKIITTMHTMEIELIKQLAESGRVTREAMLMIDGSLQFYGNLEQEQEAFRNVVGVAKSFDLHQKIGTGERAKEAGALVAGLRRHHRTPARKVEHRNLKIGAWYLRLHSGHTHAGLTITDGVVKLEVFPENPTSDDAIMDANRCEVISSNVLALRHPTTPRTDGRWASHLYPIHLTETYIKKRFRSDQVIRASL